MIYDPTEIGWAVVAWIYENVSTDGYGVEGWIRALLLTYIQSKSVVQMR